MGKINNIRNEMFLWIGFIGSICSIIGLIFVFFPISKKLDTIQDKLNQQEAESTLMSYFAFIENNDYEKAFNLFSEDKKINQTYDGFVGWLHNFVAFEGLRITELTEKNSAIQKVYLAEFGFKKRGEQSIPTKRGFYVKYNGNEGRWEINYSNVLYDENGWNRGACDFYTFDHCK